MINFPHNEKGMTLIELLATVVITTIIAMLAFSLLINGLNATKTIQKEITLRDEADYLMAALVKQLYTTKESKIEHHYLPQNGTKDYYLAIQTDEEGIEKFTKTGFIQNELIINDQAINVQNSDVKIDDSSTIKMTDNGEYEVVLVLQFNNNKTVFKNSIKTINDESEERDDGL